MPRLRVLAGPSYDEMTAIEPNNNKAYPIRSDLFEGKVIVHIKGFSDEQGVVSESDYFQREDRRDITWSIQVQGELSGPLPLNLYIFGIALYLEPKEDVAHRMEWRCHFEWGLLLINILTFGPRRRHIRICYLLNVKGLYILILRSFQ